MLCWGVYGRVQHGDGVEVMAAGDEEADEGLSPLHTRVGK